MITYLSHAIGSLADRDLIQRGDNIANAVDWFRYLAHATRLIMSMPWFASVAALGMELRDRALLDQRVMLRRHDAIVFVGSPAIGHQLVERTDARRFHVADIDLTDQGFAPPSLASKADAKLRRLIERRTSEALAKVRRAL